MIQKVSYIYNNINRQPLNNHNSNNKSNVELFKQILDKEMKKLEVK